MPTDDEQIAMYAYRDYSDQIIGWAYSALLRALPLGHPRNRGFGQGFTEGFPSVNWLTDPRGAWLKVLSPKTGVVETIQVTVGAREKWHPVVSVASTTRDPVSIENTGNAKADSEQVEKEIKQCLEQLGI